MRADVIKQVREALKECADDLEGEILARSPRRDGEYAVETRRRNRDLETVVAARAALTLLNGLGGVDEAIKAAFYEGYNSYRTPCVSYSDVDEEWEQSDARAALGAQAEKGNGQ